jgi:hypothetical protein
MAIKRKQNRRTGTFYRQKFVLSGRGQKVFNQHIFGKIGREFFFTPVFKSVNNFNRFGYRVRLSEKRAILIALFCL